MDSLNDGASSGSFAARVLTVVGIVAAVVLLILLFGFLFNVFLLVLAAILTAGFFRGIASWIHRHAPFSMTWSMIISLMLVFILIAALNLLLVPSVIHQANQLTDQLPSSIENAKQYLQSHWWGRQLASEIPRNPTKFLSQHANWAMKTVGLLTSAFGILSNFYIIALIGLFIMFNPSPYVNGIVSLVPASAQQRARQVIGQVYTILQRWLAGKLLSMLVVAILTAIGLFVIGMPLVLFLSIFAGLLAFIPNFGPIISIIPSLLIAALQGPTTMLYVVIVYIAVQIIESNLITPFIQREMVYLPLAMVIIAQVVLGVLVGGLGLIFATPIVAIIMVLVRMLYIEDVLGQSVVGT